ncbi:MAG TPA: ATP-dependent Clp protease ATP-binding subunit ClpX, partial [Pseudomonas sp.]|nr:ATP-dependent Clp protease ATP-binding subunit ClpX [Pseudomonas sp.]
RAVMEGALQRTMFEMPAQPQLRSCLLDLDGEGGELVVLRQFDEHLDAQSDAARPAVSAGARALLRVDG